MKKILHCIVDHSTKTIIPEDLNLFQAAINDFQSGERITVTIESFVRPVSLNQMSLAHKYISVIADSVGHTTQELKSVLKVKFGARNDDGSLKSTSLYSTVEMSKFIDSIFIYGTQDLGLTMPLPNDLKNKNIQ